MMKKLLVVLSSKIKEQPRSLGIEYFLLVGMILLVGRGALAVGAGITYQGRLIDPSGNPVVSSSVQFKVQLRTPGVEDCLLYEEVQTKNLSETDGIFSISIFDGSGLDLIQATIVWIKYLQTKSNSRLLMDKC
ncbi:MAG: hypothetical protein IPK04_02610 [Bdellovibrionales bacterium]|nr:hypothetical protein [Bdellovibrionales bacterium]